MLPKWHILFGFFFTVLIWIASPNINLLFLLLLFLSTFLIDFDHYLCAVVKCKNLSLAKAHSYNLRIIEEQLKKKKSGIYERGDFHFFHTIEAHIIIGLLGVFWDGFFYVLLGMIFHSLLDLYTLLVKKDMHIREYFFFRWLWKKIKRS